MLKALRIIAPRTDDSPRMGEFRDTNKEFYKNLKRGDVDPKDFERYIYGGSYNKRSQDDADRVEDKVRKDVDKMFRSL